MDTHTDVVPLATLCCAEYTFSDAFGEMEDDDAWEEGDDDVMDMEAVPPPLDEDWPVPIPTNGSSFTNRQEAENCSSDDGADDHDDDEHDVDIGDKSGAGSMLLSDMSVLSVVENRHSHKGSLEPAVCDATSSIGDASTHGGVGGGIGTADKLVYLIASNQQIRDAVPRSSLVSAVRQSLALGATAGRSRKGGLRVSHDCADSAGSSASGGSGDIDEGEDGDDGWAMSWMDWETAAADR